MTPRERARDGARKARLWTKPSRLMNKHRLERVLVVNGDFELRGLITVKDITKSTEHPLAAKDEHGKLRVGGAVGAGEDSEDASALMVPAGVDVLIVDTAHGHHQGRARPRAAGSRRTSPRSMSSAATSPRRPPPGRWSSRRRRRQGRHRPRLDLHDPHRRRRRRAADHRDLERGRGARRHRRAAASPTAASAIRATSPRRLPPAPDTVMMGSMFAGTEEAPGEVILLPGPQLQVLPRHGQPRRDEQRARPTATSRTTTPTPTSSCPRASRAGAVQGQRAGDHLPAGRRRAREHGLLRLRRPSRSCATRPSSSRSPRPACANRTSTTCRSPRKRRTTASNEPGRRVASRSARHLFRLPAPRSPAAARSRAHPCSHQRILILDFGSQVTQLIARRVREAGVFSEVHPNDVSDEFVRDFAPQA